MLTKANAAAAAIATFEIVILFILLSIFSENQVDIRRLFIRRRSVCHRKSNGAARDTAGLAFNGGSFVMTSPSVDQIAGAFVRQEIIWVDRMGVLTSPALIGEVIACV
jgi:hypothetical protein